MSQEINKLFLSDYGIAITGYATRMPEKGINDLFAFFAIARQQEIILSKKITTSEAGSVKAQIHYTNQVILSFHELLLKRSLINLLIHHSIALTKG